MRTAALALAGLTLAGCFKPTWRRVEPGQPQGQGTVILVGSFVADPPIDQHKVRRDCGGTWVNGHYEPPGKVIFVQETDGNLMAFFSPDLSERWDSEAARPITAYDWTYVPVEGHFFVEIPRTERIYLRGFTYLTNVGASLFELPAQVDVGPQDRVVYVGEIRVHRGAKKWAEFRDRLGDAKRAAKESGLDDLLRLPWKTRVLKTTGNGPSLGDEYRDGCTGRKRV